MSSPERASDRALGPSARARARWVAAALAAPTLAILGVALWLSPDPAGHGTHTQLGLNGCSILTWTGYPCPMCGMTTSFSLAAHLRPLQAVVAQPFGFVLFSVTLALAAVASAELVWPTGRLRRLYGALLAREGALSALFLAGLAAGWLYKIWQLSAG